MFEYLRKIFSDLTPSSENTAADSTNINKNKKVEIAACALFIEMAKADGEFTDDERDFVISEMKNTFNLGEEYVNELISLAEERVKQSVSLYEFTGVINTTFTQEEKLELIESLWRLIYKDKKLRNKQIYRLLGNVPTLAANAYRQRIGKEYNLPSSNLGYVENFLYMMDRLNEGTYRPHPKLVRALEVLFILHAEHEINCSTAAVR